VKQMFSKVLLSTGLCLALSPAYATNLNPGGTVSPVPGFTYLTGPPVFPSGSPNAVSTTGANPLLQEGYSWSPAGGSTKANITFENGVYVDPNTGDLDFFYQIQNTYTGAAMPSNTVSPLITMNMNLEGVQVTGVSEITSTNFQSFDDFVAPTAGDKISSVSLCQTTLSPCAAGYEPDGNANVFVTFSGSIVPSSDSAILVIQTNAKDFDQAGEGTFSWKATPPPGAHQGATLVTNPFTLDALEPLPVPEPGFYGVLSLGLAGLLLLVHRRSGKAKIKSDVEAV